MERDFPKPLSPSRKKNKHNGKHFFFYFLLREKASGWTRLFVLVGKAEERGGSHLKICDSEKREKKGKIYTPFFGTKKGERAMMVFCVRARARGSISPTGGNNPSSSLFIWWMLMVGVRLCVCVYRKLISVRGCIAIAGNGKWIEKSKVKIE